MEKEELKSTFSEWLADVLLHSETWKEEYEAATGKSALHNNNDKDKDNK